ncbi:MAG: VOC family protein [Spongiibacteraceae bacterium]|jgi:catechol 2,3-dioxygenase-like lactoylglutathione lyase family enzyme|nr:VOC family protein [Spongiibacteraceae bacterium]
MSSATASQRPPATGGLRHLALFVAEWEATVHFYTELLGMAIEWQPDTDNIYLCSGVDNLALHRYRGAPRDPAQQRLDHLGFVLNSPDHVDAWHDFLSQHGVRILQAPRTHRDGARSFYCADPDGNAVQMIHHPPISGIRFSAP